MWMCYSVYGHCVLDLAECLPHTHVMISTQLPNYEENAQRDMLSEVIVTTKIRQIRSIKIIKQLMAVTNFTSSANACFSLFSCSFFLFLIFVFSIRSIHWMILLASSRFFVPMDESKQMIDSFSGSHGTQPMYLPRRYSKIRLKRSTLIYTR